MDIEDLNVNEGAIAEALAEGVRVAVAEFVATHERMPDDGELGALVSCVRAIVSALVVHPNSNVVDVTLDHDDADRATARLSVLFDDGARVRIALASPKLQ
ncbi:hypothetical protein AB4Y43_18285 [Paraburkholderia sp. BR10872]|uniref:hypothetical protein n=1 Tax=Paraburkholderia sp. BR10872 TaxID=3236989 RepID=UPI0034D36EC3